MPAEVRQIGKGIERLVELGQMLRIERIFFKIA